MPLSSLCFDSLLSAIFHNDNLGFHQHFWEVVNYIPGGNYKELHAFFTWIVHAWAETLQHEETYLRNLAAKLKNHHLHTNTTNWAAGCCFTIILPLYIPFFLLLLILFDSSLTYEACGIKSFITTYFTLWRFLHCCNAMLL